MADGSGWIELFRAGFHAVHNLMAAVEPEWNYGDSLGITVTFTKYT